MHAASTAAAAGSSSGAVASLNKRACRRVISPAGQRRQRRRQPVHEFPGQVDTVPDADAGLTQRRPQFFFDEVLVQLRATARAQSSASIAAINRNCTACNRAISRYIPHRANALIKRQRSRIEIHIGCHAER
jgi:hypothetical protein